MTGAPNGSSECPCYKMRAVHILARLTRRRSLGLSHLVAGLASVLLALGADLAGGLHLATVQHVVCPVHGELLHEAGSDHAAHAIEAGTVQDGLARVAPEQDEETHEVCDGVVTVREEQPGLTGPSPQALPLMQRTGTQTPFSTHALSSVPLLRLAPKQSPPV